MAMRIIREEGDAILLKHSRPVTDFNKRLHTLLDDMRETLLAADGVGLAAPQVGILRRAVIVMDTNKVDLAPEEQIIELINPQIVSADGEQTGQEGCLSVPGVYGIVTRPEHVVVKAQDRFGKPFTVEGTGLTARCFCHEIAHLDGHLFTELVEGPLYTEEELDAAQARQERRKKGRRGE